MLSAVAIAAIAATIYAFIGFTLFKLDEREFHKYGAGDPTLEDVLDNVFWPAKLASRALDWFRFTALNAVAAQARRIGRTLQR